MRFAIYALAVQSLFAADQKPPEISPDLKYAYARNVAAYFQEDSVSAHAETEKAKQDTIISQAESVKQQLKKTDEELRNKLADACGASFKLDLTGDPKCVRVASSPTK